MRYPASEKLEIIRLVEESALPVRWTLEKIGIPRATFYRWYDLYQAGGPEALDDRHPKPDRVWNRIPDDVRERIINLALEQSALSPRELAVRFTDTEGYFVSGGFGLSAPQGPQSDRQSSLHRDEGRRRVQG
jgi:putative transposase